jgi:hypothetical protein
VGPLHQLHGEEALAFGHVEIVEAGEVSVGEVAQRAELLLEEVELLGVGPREETLQRDLDQQLPVPRSVDGPHGAGADMRAQLVSRRPECRRGRQLFRGHGWGRTRVARRWQGVSHSGLATKRTDLEGHRPLD